MNNSHFAKFENSIVLLNIKTSSIVYLAVTCQSIGHVLRNIPSASSCCLSHVLKALPHAGASWTPLAVAASLLH